MNIEKNKLKMGIWYEGKNGEFIPATNSDPRKPPEDAYTYHSCFPLKLSENVYIIRNEYGEIIDKPFPGRKLMVEHTHIGGGFSDLILAMANSGDYTVSEAITVIANACERCINVLTYMYLDGKDGYPEHSESWKQCNTVCDFCREEI